MAQLKTRVVFPFQMIGTQTLSWLRINSSRWWLAPLFLFLSRAHTHSQTPATAMAVSSVSASLNLLIHDSRGSTAPRISSPMYRLPASNFTRNATSFLRGSPLLIRTSSYETQNTSKLRSVPVRCEQSAKAGNGLDVWLGRLEMAGFAVAISVEIATGKGLLENFGVTTPLPTAALGVTALVGILTAVFIFQSASKT